MKKLLSLAVAIILAITCVPALAEEWNDAYPTIPALATEETYAYDDMSQHYDIEMLVIGYINVPVEPDPVKANIEKKFNIDLTFTAMSQGDLESILMARFAAGDAPDLIRMSTKALALQLYQEGMTMNPEQVLIDYMPSVRQYVTKNFKTFVTDPDSGDMFAITQLGGPNIWGYFYRSDWLKKFGMEEPVTPDALYDYAMACTYNDPDGNGEDDTWFMGTGGGGGGWSMMSSFRSMYGHPSYNVVDGKINHPMLDGTSKQFLEFLNKLYEAGTFCPDFYTTDWESFKSYTMNDKIGMVNYPGDQLLTEYLSAKGGLSGCEDVASNIVTWAPLTKAPSVTGEDGKYEPGTTPGGLLILNSDLEQDEGKLKRLCHLVDWWVYPNEGFFETQHGGSPYLYYDYTDVWPFNTEIEYNIGFNPETGKYVWDTSAFNLDPLGYPVSQSNNNMGLHDYQALSLQYTYKEYTHEVYGAQQNYNNNTVNAIPRWENYDILLSLDADKTLACSNLTAENEILFVTGQKSFDEWDSYVQRWLDIGGEALLQQAAEQLGVER